MRDALKNDPKQIMDASETSSDYDYGSDRDYSE